MAGAPTEAELQTQWRNAIAMIDAVRVLADDTIADPGGLMDTLVQSLEGEVTPVLINNAVTGFRATLSSLVDASTVGEFITPFIEEYAALLAADTDSGFGSGYTSTEDLMTALYEHFNDNNLTVQTRGIVFDGSATAGASNVGNGSIARLTVDENNFPLEFCTVEKKIFRCRADQNSGVLEDAETFEVLGQQASIDSLNEATHGSGDTENAFIAAHHAGTGAGGSELRNSSFSLFDGTNTSQKFSSWEQDEGADNLFDQDTTNFYRTAPNDDTSASLRLTGGSGTVRIKQSLEEMRISSLDPDTPYFLRVMFNAEVGSAVGGSLTIRLGSQSQSVAISGQTGWTELMIPAGTKCWFRNFNERDFDIEIQWASSTSGTLLIDDVLFAPWDFVDGTYWFLRASSSSHTPWAVDDTLQFTDTGGAPTSGKIQYYLFRAGLGYLPSSGTPTFTDPA